eukprot:2502373-Amphidinium_carterae.1
MTRPSPPLLNSKVGQMITDGTRAPGKALRMAVVLDPGFCFEVRYPGQWRVGVGGMMPSRSRHLWASDETGMLP